MPLPSRQTPAEDVMPSRWLCAAIVAFWLAVNGWLLWHDLLPRWRPGQPPPVTIDLIDEVSGREYTGANWSVWANGHKAYEAFTWVEPDKDVKDLYVLRFRLRPGPSVKGVASAGGGLIKVEVMTSECRVTADGHFLGLKAKVEAVPTGLSRVQASVEGEVREGLFHGHYRVEVPVLGVSEGDLEPVALGRNGAVMMAVHPLQRLPGLRPGQTWTEPSLDLLPGLTGMRMRLNLVPARVLPDVETVRWGSSDRSCLVVEYRDDAGETRTWVEREGGLVLRQETTFWGERWVLQRQR
jgi:hypothetical protein